jgi:hypothetical protein
LPSWLSRSCGNSVGYLHTEPVAKPGEGKTEYYTKGERLMIPRSEKKGRSWLLLLLLIPFIVMLWPPFYNFREPALFGIPFFYWFQLLWTIITAILTAIVYFAGA